VAVPQEVPETARPVLSRYGADTDVMAFVGLLMVCPHVPIRIVIIEAGRPDPEVQRRWPSSSGFCAEWLGAERPGARSRAVSITIPPRLRALLQRALRGFRKGSMMRQDHQQKGALAQLKVLPHSALKLEKLVVQPMLVQGPTDPAELFAGSVVGPCLRWHRDHTTASGEVSRPGGHPLVAPAAQSCRRLTASGRTSGN
jgi:hypothetical protein